MATSGVTPEPRGLQDRIEASAAGRALISAFAIVTVVALVFWNLPESELRARAFPVVEPYVRSTGLDQNWGVFAPDPRRATVELVGRATYADGRVEDFEIPAGGPLVGAYWDYRWRKWSEWTASDDHGFLWQPAAAWFARRASADGEEPVQVMLVRKSYPLFPPGPGPAHGDWEEHVLYTLPVRSPDAGP